MTDKNAVLKDILKVTDEIKQVKTILNNLYGNEVKEVIFIGEGPRKSTFSISDPNVSHRITDIVVDYSQSLMKKLEDLCALYSAQ